MVANDGRYSEACVGILMALEESHAGLSGIVIWGLHRDSAELMAIRLPVFSLGALPADPHRLDSPLELALSSVTCDQHIGTGDDFVLSDDDGVIDGVIFVPLDRAGDVAELATTIRDTERNQVTKMRLSSTSDVSPASRNTSAPGVLTQTSRFGSTCARLAGHRRMNCIRNSPAQI